MMSKVYWNERVGFDDSDSNAKIKKTANGFITAVPRVARTGVQIYASEELNLPPGKTIKVLRPENEVFDSTSLKTYTHNP